MYDSRFPARGYAITTTTVIVIDMHDDHKSSTFSMPAWVCWIAQDEDGVWWGYSVEPLRHDHGWYENEVGRYIRIGISKPDHWESSLQRVARVVQ